MKVQCRYGDIVEAYKISKQMEVSEYVKINGQCQITINAVPSLKALIDNGSSVLTGDAIVIKRLEWGGVEKGYYTIVRAYESDGQCVVKSSKESDAAISWSEVVQGLVIACGSKVDLARLSGIPRRTLYNWLGGKNEPSNYGKIWADTMGKKLLPSARARYMASYEKNKAGGKINE